jgi:hypothetical protein
MFESVWMPINALASKILATEAAPETISSALAIVTSSIAIAARFFMETESIVCMSSLATFTRLQTWAPIEVQNLRAIRELLELSKTFSSYFEPVWGKILMLFTQLNALILAHSTALPGEQAIPEIVKTNAELVSQYVPQHAIDELFERSSTFEPPALVSFVTALCRVSNRELGQHPPSTFCLQRIIEVTDANMGQDRGWFTWRLIWKPVSQHLVEAGCFPQEGIARSALDSLRQLANKFLGQGELSGFHYQRDFLKPFHMILRKSKSRAIRLHALRCVNHTVRRHHAKMKSGWETVLNMLESAAAITEVNRLALTVLIDLLERNLRPIIDEGLTGQVMKTISRFVMIGRKIRTAALYVMAGVFEQMVKIGILGNELSLVLSAMGNAMNDADAAAVIIEVMSKSVVPPIWGTVLAWVKKVIVGKSEKWYRRSAEPLISWVLRDSAGSHPEEAAGLIVHCVDIPNPKIARACSACLATRLATNPAGRKAAALFARRSMESVAQDSTEAQVVLKSALAVRLARLLEIGELLDFRRVLQPFIKAIPDAGRAVLALSLILLEQGEISVGEAKSLAHELFDASDEGKQIVVEELMKLDDANFDEISRSVAVKAASVIVSEKEGLRGSLARFFTRVSRDCLAEPPT